MRRSHINLPLTNDSGDLLLYATVTVQDPATGAPVTVPMYADNGDSSPTLENPMVIAPSIFEVWSDQPMRVNLLIDGSDGFQTTLTGVDIVPDPVDVVRSPSLTQVTNAAEVERVLTAGAGSRASWAFPTVIPHHDHDGLKPGSTMLDEGDTAVDNQPNQTWVGYQSGSSATDQTGATSLGAATDPAGRYVTALGAGSTVRTSSDGSTPYAATVLGSDAYATAESVSLGDRAGRDAAHSVSMSADDDGSQQRYVQPMDAFLRHLRTTDTVSFLGSALATPDTPQGVAMPLWLRQNTVAPGRLQASRSVTLGSVTSLLGFFGQAGVGKQSLPRDTNIPALASLLTALESYGLTTLTDALPSGGGPANEVALTGTPRFEQGGTPVGGSMEPYTDDHATWWWWGSPPYLDVADQDTNYAEKQEDAASASAGTSRWIALYLDPWTPPAGKVVVDARLEMEAWVEAGAFVWGLNDPVSEVYLGGSPDATFPSGTWTQRTAGKADPADPYGPYALYAPGEPGYELADLVRALASGQAFIEASNTGNTDGTGKRVLVSQLRLVLTLADA